MAGRGKVTYTMTQFHLIALTWEIDYSCTKLLPGKAYFCSKQTPKQPCRFNGVCMLHDISYA